MYDEYGVPVASYSNQAPRRWFGKVAQVIILAALVLAVMRLLIPAEKEPETPTPEATVTEATMTAKDFYAQGESYLETDQYSEAIDAFNQAIELGYDPIARAYFERGWAEYFLEDYEAAVVSYTQSLELSPDCDECHIDYFNRALVYWELEEYQLAVDDFTEAIEVNPAYLAAYVSRLEIWKIQNEDSLSTKLVTLERGFDKSATSTETRNIIAGQRRELEFKSGGQQYQFSFTADEGDKVTFSVPAASVDVVLLLRDPSGNAVTYDDSGDHTGGDELTTVIKTPGDYTLTVATYPLNALGEFSLSMEKDAD